MLQVIEHLIAHKGARRVRHRRGNAGCFNRAHHCLERQGAEIRRRPLRHDRRIDRLIAEVVGNAGIVDIDRHPLDADISAAGAQPDGDHQFRLELFQQLLQLPGCPAKGAGQLAGDDTYIVVQVTVQKAHGLPGRVDGILVKRFETGQQYSAHQGLTSAGKEARY